MVLINIEMPNNCSECKYQYEFQGIKRCQLNYGRPMERGWKEERANWCQLRELPEQIPKKPIEPQEDYGTFMCPSCRGLIYTEDTFETHRYCLLCGQALDWSNKNLKEEPDENRR